MASGQQYISDIVHKCKFPQALGSKQNSVNPTALWL